LKSKNPSPDAPLTAGLDFTPASGPQSLQLGERAGVSLETSNGIMEWWPPARRAYGSERIMEY